MKAGAEILEKELLEFANVVEKSSKSLRAWTKKARGFIALGNVSILRSLINARNVAKNLGVALAARQRIVLNPVLINRKNDRIKSGNLLAILGTIQVLELFEWKV